MTIANHERAMVRQLRTAAHQRGISVESLCDGWILRFSRGGRTVFVYGYTFDLNLAASHQVVCDKSATSEVLTAAGVPCVPHIVYLHPEMVKFVPTQRGNWSLMLATCEDLGWDVVVKENTGTGGRGVQRIRDALTLEHAVYTLFQRNSAICLSKYYDADHEIRCVLLDGKVELAFAKQRPSVTGDGSSTVLELIAHAKGGIDRATRQLLESAEPDTARLFGAVPAKGSEFLLNWRHNLGQGATALLLSDADAESGTPQGPSALGHAAMRARQLAIQAAQSLNLRFGSVDVLLTREGPKILEVNGGVMMEFIARGMPGGEATAARIYCRALDAMFP
jgi:glutathione synthase/RimK-type ligase-like ATP-grasp enzyme